MKNEKQNPMKITGDPLQDAWMLSRFLTGAAAFL